MKLFAASAALVFAVLSLVGCGSTGDKDPSKLGSVEKAQAVTRLCKEAEICLQQFVASEGDEGGIDIDALLCYVEKLKTTTKIYPNPNLCSSCYAQYGEALRMLGGYYRTLSLKQEESATKADPELGELGYATRGVEEDRSLAQRALVGRRGQLRCSKKTPPSTACPGRPPRHGAVVIDSL